MNSSLKLLLIAFFFALNVVAIRAQTTFLNVGLGFYGNNDEYYSKPLACANNSVLITFSRSNGITNYSELGSIDENGQYFQTTFDSLPVMLYSQVDGYLTNVSKKNLLAAHSFTTLSNEDLKLISYVDSTQQTLWTRNGFSFQYGTSTDSSFVFFDFISNSIVCLSFDGSIVWSRAVQDYSPIIYWNDTYSYPYKFYLNNDTIITAFRGGLSGNYYITKIDISTGIEYSNSHSLGNNVKDVLFLNTAIVSINQIEQSGIKKLVINKFDNQYNIVKTKEVLEYINSVEFQSCRLRNDKLLLSVNVKDTISNIQVEIPAFQIYNLDFEVLNQRFFRATYSIYDGLIIDSKSLRISGFDQTEDGGYYFTGTMMPNTYDAANYSLKLDSNLLSPDTFFLFGKHLYFSNPDSQFYLSNLTVSELNNFSTLSVYPNPASSIIVISSSSSMENAIVELFDLTGRSVLNDRTALHAGNPTQVDVSRIPSGLYVVRIEANQRVATSRISVMH